MTTIDDRAVALYHVMRAHEFDSRRLHPFQS
jgi:hypothetical protein